MALINASTRLPNRAGGSGRFAGVGMATGGMLSLVSAMGIGRFVYTPILPTMAAALGLSKADAGLIASANFVGYLAGALLLALPGVPGDRRSWFLAALAAGAATTAAMALADSMPAFLLLRFAGGLATAFVLITGSTLIVQPLAAAGRGHLAAVYFAGVGIGIALSAGIVDALEGAGIGWRGLWLAAAAASAILIPGVAWLTPRPPASATPIVAAAPEAARLPRALYRLVLCQGLFGFGYVVTATFIVAIVRGAPGARSIEPVVWLVVGLAAIPSTAIWGWVGGRVGVFRAFGLACLAQAVGVLAGGVWSTAPGALVAAALLGGTFVGLTALGLAAARTLAPGQQRRSFAAITASFGLGQVLGPIVAGWLLDRTGSFVLPSVLAALALVAAAVLAVRMRD